MLANEDSKQAGNKTTKLIDRKAVKQLAIMLETKRTINRASIVQERMQLRKQEM